MLRRWYNVYDVDSQRFIEIFFFLIICIYIYIYRNHLNIKLLGADSVEYNGPRSKRVVLYT